MSVGDAITCECNNCVDEEIKTVSSRHAEALEHLFVLSSKARCEADHAEVAERTFLHIELIEITGETKRESPI